MLIRTLIGSALFAIAAVAHGGTAEICYSDPAAFGAAPSPTNTMIFRCPIAGDKTLPQLGNEGWEIVQLLPISVNNNTQQAQQIVIQKR